MSPVRSKWIKNVVLGEPNIKIVWLLAASLGILIVALPDARGQLFEADSKQFGSSKMDIVLKEVERRPRASVVEIKITSCRLLRRFLVFYPLQHSASWLDCAVPTVTLSNWRSSRSVIRCSSASWVTPKNLRRRRGRSFPEPAEKRSLTWNNLRRFAIP